MVMIYEIMISFECTSVYIEVNQLLLAASIEGWTQYKKETKLYETPYLYITNIGKFYNISGCALGAELYT